MYPLQTTDVITQAETEVENVHDGLRGAILALEVEKSTMADKTQSFEADLQAILGLGVLLNDLETRRIVVAELGAQLPSPNKVEGDLRERTIAIGKKLFETAEHIRNIQSETYRIARLNLRAACHKMGRKKAA
jgi:hypothetical protein